MQTELFRNAQNVDASGATFLILNGSQHTYPPGNHNNGNTTHSLKSTTNETLAVLDDLHRSNVAAAKYNFRDRYPPPCEPGTRTDILKKIFEWVSGSKGHSICWLYGKGGSGKLAIAQSVSEHFSWDIQPHIGSSRSLPNSQLAASTASSRNRKPIVAARERS